MIEVEIKLSIADAETVEMKLQNLGFQKENLMRESDVYLNSTDFNLREKDRALRIRNCENLSTGETQTVLTYKGPKMDHISMTRQELETEVADANVCQEILMGIGYTQIYPVCKLRQYYQKEEVTACVDRVERLGDFLELEILTDNENGREKALKQLNEMLEKLGYRMEDTIYSSYLSMLQANEGRC